MDTLRRFVRDLNQAESELLGITSDVNEYIVQSGYHAFVPDFLASGLRHLKSTVELPKRPSFFDYGCGPGKMLAIARLEGFDAYGMDLNPQLVAAAPHIMQRLEKNKLLDRKTKWKAVEGSYFPTAYQELRRRGEAKALEHEAAEGVFGNIGVQAIDTDSYAKLGRGLDSFDVLFAYAWNTQLPAILEMHARYARDDAVLIYYASKCHTDIAALTKELGLYTAKPRIDDTIEDMLQFVSKDKSRVAPISQPVQPRCEARPA